MVKQRKKGGKIKMSKKIKMIFSIMLIILILLPISSTFAATQVECKPGTIPWVGITVSNSYQVCQDMVNASSSIGDSSLLDSHLTTNKDYNAVAMLSASDYGYGLTGSTTSVSNTGGTVYIKDDGTIDTTGTARPYYSTTGNASGVMDLGADPYLSTLRTMSTIENVYCQTASLLSESKNITNNNYITNLLTAINNEATKKYVDEIYSGYTTYSASIRQIITGENGRENSANKGMGIWTEETFGQTCYWGHYNSDWRSRYPVVIRLGVFGFAVAGSVVTYGNVESAVGRPSTLATFRPVIWNS
jgi:hypothetical protein